MGLFVQEWPFAGLRAGHDDLRVFGHVVRRRLLNHRLEFNVVDVSVENIQGTLVVNKLNFPLHRGFRAMNLVNRTDNFSFNLTLPVQYLAQLVGGSAGGKGD